MYRYHSVSSDTLLSSTLSSKYSRNDKLKLRVSLGLDLVQLAPLLQDFLLFTFWQIGPNAATVTCRPRRRAGSISTLVHTTQHWLPVYFSEHQHGTISFASRTIFALAPQCSLSPGEQFRGYKSPPFGEDDYSVVIIQSWDSNRHISCEGRWGRDALQCINCFHRAIHIVYTTSSCLSWSHYTLRRIIKWSTAQTTKCASTARSNKLVPLCCYVGFDTAVTSIDEENACSSHAPLKHEKQCRQAGWRPNQHSAGQIKILTSSSLRCDLGGLERAQQVEINDPIMGILHLYCTIINLRVSWYFRWKMEVTSSQYFFRQTNSAKAKDFFVTSINNKEKRQIISIKGAICVSFCLKHIKLTTINNRMWRN